MRQGLLFSEHFLREGIRTTGAYKALEAERQDLLRETLAELRQAFAKFPVSATPSESQTEHDLVFPVLEALGWDRDRYLTQPRAARKGRSDVPDMLLFASPADKERANAESVEADRFRHGVVVVENKRWARPLDRAARDGAEDDVPSTQMLRYMSRAETLSDRRIQWGILTNGRLWRLYHQGAKSRSEEYLEIDLSVVLGVEGIPPDLFTPPPDEREHWLRVFVLMFGRPSFTEQGDAGRSFHQIALDEGRLWEERVADDLSRVVFERIFPDLANAIDRAHPEPVRPRTDAYLAEIKHAALVLLYRLLFLLYAEDRELLPVRDRRYDDYGLSRKRDEIARRLDEGDPLAESWDVYYAHLRRLFRAIGEGETSLGIPPYNGGLFDRKAAPLLDRIELPDAAFAPLLDALSRHDDGARRRRINYRDLSVQQLGSIYERLLEFELVEAGETVAVEGDQAGRKGSGSYYTPEELVGLILERTVGPLLLERLEAFKRKAAELARDRRPRVERLRELTALDPASGFLDIKVCDPAMGSGHFLVSLVDFLADRVLEAIAAAPALVPFADEASPYESPLVRRIEAIRRRILNAAEEGRWVVDEDQLDDRRLVRRMILKRVIHGVDKNPMAVELAKVALWLHTFTVGAPLSFLDHHLRCGDSLLGLRVRPVADWLEGRGALLINRYIAAAERSAATMAEIETITDTDISEVRDSAEKYAALEEATGPLAALLSLVQAERMMGVFEAAPRKRPPPVADLIRAGKPQRVIERARADRVAWEKAAAFQTLFDGGFGDPVRIAMGEIAVAPAETVEQFALSLDEDPPEQAALFAEPEVDQRQRARAQQLLTEARRIAAEHRFLHWEVAFPNVWRNWMSARPAGGFDAVVGNPPYVRQELLGAIKPALKRSYDSFDGMADLYVYFYELGLRLLRPGGRLSYVVTNKWLRAGYAESLRQMFAEKAWMELVADFGHAKQFFRDADVFPCVIAARRPDGTEPPADTEVCVIPREEVRPADLIKQVADLSYPVPRVSLGRAGWSLEPPAVTALMEKIRAAGVPLTEYAGVKPLYGIKTGFNEAFLINTATRDALIATDANCADLIKPYLRGQDVDRWYAPNSGVWMIVLKSSGDHPWPWADAGNDAEAIFASTYPALYRHFKPHEQALRKRQDKGRYWWELRPCAYYEFFLGKKIVYQEIQFYPAFAKDSDGRLGNNKTYFVPIDDDYILAILNSPLMWWHNWRYLTHLKDEALSPQGYRIEQLPIAPPIGESADRAAEAVDRLVEINRVLHETRVSLTDWYRHEHGIEKPSARLREPFAMEADAFVAEVRKALGRRARRSAAAVQSLKEEHARSVAPARALLAEAGRLERRLSDLVNAAYGLTPEEVRLMWDTAPPRMPIAPG